jgi:hypothetical protein
MPHIEHILVLSNDHLDDNAREILTRAGSTMNHRLSPDAPERHLLVDERDAGWLVVTPLSLPVEEREARLEEMEKGRVPNCILDAFKLAIANNCEWVLYDRDADHDPALRVYNPDGDENENKDLPE